MDTDTAIAMNLLAAIRRETNRLEAAVILADAYQWSRPPSSPLPGRPKGGPPADPTGETAVDSDRLTLRRTSRTAPRHLTIVARALASLAAEFDRALLPIVGDED
jgi:hypothetical protein